MIEGSNLDDTIACIYRAAVGAAAWSHALQRIAEDLHATRAHLVGVDPSSGTLRFRESAPARGMALDARARRALVDPRVVLSIAGKAGEWLYFRGAHDPESAEALPADDLREASAAAIKLAEAVDEIVVCMIEARDESPRFGRAQRDHCERLGVHLGEAVRLQRRIRPLARSGALGAGLISRNSRPMAMIDRDCTLRATNAAFDALLAERKLFEVAGSMLQFADAALERSVGVAIREISAAGGRGERTRVMPLGTQRGNVFAVTVTMLLAKESLQGFGAGPQFLLTAHGRPSVGDADTHAWRAAFHLSPAETKVAAHIFAGKAPKEIARALNVCPSTVKSQLDSIFAKTATTRQAELVRVLSTMSA